MGSDIFLRIAAFLAYRIIHFKFPILMYLDGVVFNFVSEDSIVKLQGY